MEDLKRQLSTLRLLIQSDLARANAALDDGDFDEAQAMVDSAGARIRETVAAEQTARDAAIVAA